MAAVALSNLIDPLGNKLRREGPADQTIQLAVPKQPDIAYHPDRGKWHDRTARRLAEDPSLLGTTLPGGFPLQLDSPLVWEGKDWQDEKQWVYELNSQQLKEIDDAVQHFNGKSTLGIRSM